MKTKKLRQADELKAGDIIYSGDREIYQIVNVLTEPVYETKELLGGATVMLRQSELRERRLRQLVFAPKDAAPKSAGKKNEKGGGAKSPYPGVYRVNSKKNPWQAYLNRPGITKWTATFPTPEEAKAALNKKIKELGVAPMRAAKKTAGHIPRYKCRTCGAAYKSPVRVCSQCNGDVEAVDRDEQKGEAMNKAIDFEDK